MNTVITQLIYRESGGFAGLQRGCTLDPQTLPDVPRAQLNHLLTQPATSLSQGSARPLPDMLVYTLELVTQTDTAQAQQDTTPARTDITAPRWLQQYPADDVPDELNELIDFLHELAQPVPPR